MLRSGSRSDYYHSLISQTIAIISRKMPVTLTTSLTIINALLWLNSLSVTTATVNTGTAKHI